MKCDIFPLIISLFMSCTLMGGFSQSPAEQKSLLLAELSELHFRPIESNNLSPQFIDELIRRVQSADLSFDDQFELRYYLTQLNYVDDIKGLPALTKKGREHLLQLTSEDTLQTIIEPLILQHFKEEHLPELLRINESDAEQIQLNESHYLIEEILHYQLSPGSKVGEIGSGDGIFGLYLHFSKNDIQLFLNEVSDERLGEIYNTLMLLKAPKSEAVIPVLGTPYSTLLEGKELDAVILRNAFHHFSDPNAMLGSIRQSIQPAGIVYLLEQFKEADDTQNHCTLLQEREYIEHIFQENGWIKTAEVYLEKQRKYLLQYRLQ